MKKNYKTSFLHAYDSNGKPNIKSLDYKKKQSGVYFIKNNKEEIVYVGFSSTNLYKTIYRHFQTWNDNRPNEVKEKRYVYPKEYKVRILFTTPEKATILEKYLIKKMQPRDNREKYINYFQSQSDEKKAVQVIETAEQFSNLEEPPF